MFLIKTWMFRVKAQYQSTADCFRLLETIAISSNTRRKHYYDMKLKPNLFKIDDWVWYFSPRRWIGKSINWQRLYSGAPTKQTAFHLKDKKASQYTFKWLHNGVDNSQAAPFKLSTIGTHLFRWPVLASGIVCQQTLHQHRRWRPSANDYKLIYPTIISSSHHLKICTLSVDLAVTYT